MKPVVSSLVALAIAIAPLAAEASRSEKSTHHGKPTSAKVVRHKVERTAKKKVERAIEKVKHKKKPAIHHASSVDLGGAGHTEPKIDRGVSVVPASLMAKAPARKRLTRVSAKRAPELPSLPSPAVEKKAAEKKRADDEQRDPGEAARGEGKESFAELVARIRGPKTAEAEVKPKPEKTCLKTPVEVIRGPEIDKFALTKCDGTVAPLAVEHLSILIRPGSAARPVAPVAELAKKSGPELAHGIRRVDPRLVARIQAVVDHFAKDGAQPKLSIISGYRPTSVGSMHATGRAIDFRMEGVKNEEVVAFCKTLSDTGCGYYPNSSFVHIDVRDGGAGHVAWIDASGPGESPRYVSAWPPPEPAKAKESEIKRPAEVLEHTSSKRVESTRTVLRETPPEPVDEHPAEADDDDGVSDSDP